MTQPTCAVVAHPPQSPAALARAVFDAPHYDRNSPPNSSTTSAPKQSDPGVNPGSLQVPARSFPPGGRVANPLEKNTPSKESTRALPAGFVPSRAFSLSSREPAPAATDESLFAPMKSTIASLERRLEKLETTMGQSFRAAAQELASSTISLCVESERRNAQLVEALRDDLSTAGMLGGCAPELASKVVPLLPQTDPRDASGEPVPFPVAQHDGQQAAIDSIIDRVLERVKQDGCLLNISAQYQQTKMAIEELNSKIGNGEFDRLRADAVRSRSQSTNVDAIDLPSIVKSTALDLRRLRQQRNSDFSEVVGRLENLETGLLSLKKKDEALTEFTSVSTSTTDAGRMIDAHQGTLHDAIPELTSINPIS